MASWQRAHQVHCYSCLPTRDIRRHHTSHLQLGHLGIWHPLDLAVARAALETRPSLLCVHALTHRRGPRDEIGSGTVQHRGYRARSTPGTRGSLPISYPLVLLPRTPVPRSPSKRRSAASRERSTSLGPAVHSITYDQCCMHGMASPAQDTFLICSAQTPPALPLCGGVCGWSGSIPR